jgi:hypothetical protein
MKNNQELNIASKEYFIKFSEYETVRYIDVNKIESVPLKAKATSFDCKEKARNAMEQYILKYQNHNKRSTILKKKLSIIEC